MMERLREKLGSAVDESFPRNYTSATNRTKSTAKNAQDITSRITPWMEVFMIDQTEVRALAQSIYAAVDQVFEALINNDADKAAKILDDIQEMARKLKNGVLGSDSR